MWIIDPWSFCWGALAGAVVLFAFVGVLFLLLSIPEVK